MVVALFMAIALVAIVYLLLRHHAAQSAAWSAERRELLNRIQRPDRIPVAPMPVFETPDSGPDEIELVGTIADAPEGDE